MIPCHFMSYQCQIESIMNHLLGTGKRVVCSIQSLGCSVTRCLDYFSNIWPCAILKNCPLALEICQSRLKFSQILNKTFEICQNLLKFCQIWSHCSVVLKVCFVDKVCKVKSFGDKSVGGSKSNSLKTIEASKLSFRRWLHSAKLSFHHFQVPYFSPNRKV